MDNFTIGKLLKSTIAKNAISLYIIQFANYIVPLIQVPYLVRVLGPAGYGSVAFAQGFINYLRLFVEYGFDWSATRKISVQRDDVQSVNNIALHVWAAKFLLSVVGLVVLMLLALIIPKLREVFWLLLVLYGLVFGNVFFPTWLFQGMERMVAISVINLGMRVASLAGVFLLVKKPEHALIYAGLIGARSIAAGSTGMIVAVRMFGLRVSRISWAGIWEVLREGWVLFLSKASVSLYTAGNAFILGMLTNYSVVGYYSAAERIAKTVVSLISPVSQAVYPRVASLSREPLKMVLYAQRLLPLMAIIGASVTLLLYFSAPIVVKFLLGVEFERSVGVLKILSFLGLNLSLATVWSTWLLIGSGREKIVLSVLLGAGLVNISLSIILVPVFLEKGMGVSYIAAETFVNLASFFYTCWLGINPINNGKRLR